MFEIDKTIIETYKFSHVRYDFTVYDKNWEKARYHSPYQGFECFFCSHKFEYGDDLALAIGILPTLNKVICNSHKEACLERPERGFKVLAMARVRVPK